MKTFRNIILSLSCLLIGATARAQINATSKGTIISVSDIHFDPFYDPSLMPALIKTNYSGWLAIFNSSAIKQPNSYGHDSNFPLLNSALAAMQKQNPKPGFILVTGDFLAHSFQSTYAQYAPGYPDSVQSFTANTIRFIALMFNKYFPNTVVLPVLGNNDSYCGDYMIGAQSPFLAMFAKAWVPLQRNHNTQTDNAFITNFSKGGYYTFALRDGSGGKLVMLNTVFFSKNYVNGCEPVPGNPARDELTWLAGILKQNSAAKSKLWLACHVPPGMDVNATLSGTGTCAQNTQAMWSDSCNTVFLKLWQQYAPNIPAGFAGHTHMDDFRLLYNDNTPIAFMHITPAISPLFTNNPGFQVINYNKATFSLVDAQTYYLNLNATTPSWSFEYDFQKAYGVTSITAASVAQVRTKIASGAPYLQRYINFYDGSNPAGNSLNNSNWKTFWCGTGNLTIAGFTNCNCSATQ